jgi:trk system potassium uptake protein TrkA
MNLAKILETQEIDCRIIEKEEATCERLEKELPKATLIRRDGRDPAVLDEVRLTSSDIFVAATNDDELNLMSGKLAKEMEAANVAVQLMNPGYRSLISKLGITYAVSPLACAGNFILSILLSGTITSVVSLYDNQAEIVEIQVSKDSKVLGIPISELGPLLPKDFLILMIQNRGRISIARGNRVLSPGDTIIVATSPAHLSFLKENF